MKRIGTAEVVAPCTASISLYLNTFSVVTAVKGLHVGDLSGDGVLSTAAPT
jgi:hypothetical protein